MKDPFAGDAIKGTGGLSCQFWLFTVYGKDMQDDLTDSQRKALRTMLEREYLLRKNHAPQPVH
ncbi:hypothetical protein ACO2TB_02145 [Pseudomonas putida]